MKKLLLPLIAMTLVANACGHAIAHYLWVTIDSKSGKHGTTNIYFEGGPAPGDGQYLDPFVQRGTTWIRTLKDKKPAKLTTQEVKKPRKRWLTAVLPQGGPRSIDSYGKWGVYRYGKTDVLLHYHARNLQVDDHGDLHELARAEQMKLDIVPHDEEGKTQLTVLWEDKPVAGRSISVRGPKGFKQKLTTDKNGRAIFKRDGKGRYTFHTFVEQKTGGEFEGKSYQLIRHHGTLIMNLPVESN